MRSKKGLETSNKTGNNINELKQCNVLNWIQIRNKIRDLDEKILLENSKNIIPMLFGSFKDMLLDHFKHHPCSNTFNVKKMQDYLTKLKLKQENKRRINIISNNNNNSDDDMDYILKRPSIICRKWTLNTLPKDILLRLFTYLPTKSIDTIKNVNISLSIFSLQVLNNIDNNKILKTELIGKLGYDVACPRHGIGMIAAKINKFYTMKNDKYIGVIACLTCNTAVTKRINYSEFHEIKDHNEYIFNILFSRWNKKFPKNNNTTDDSIPSLNDNNSDIIMIKDDKLCKHVKHKNMDSNDTNPFKCITCDYCSVNNDYGRINCMVCNTELNRDPPILKKSQSAFNNNINRYHNNNMYHRNKHNRRKSIYNCKSDDEFERQHHRKITRKHASKLEGKILPNIMKSNQNI